MDDKSKKALEVKNEENEFELMLRFFGNEILAIKLMASKSKFSFETVENELSEVEI